MATDPKKTTLGWVPEHPQQPYPQQPYSPNAYPQPPHYQQQPPQPQYPQLPLQPQPYPQQPSYPEQYQQPQYPQPPQQPHYQQPQQQAYPQQPPHAPQPQYQQDYLHQHHYPPPPQQQAWVPQHYPQQQQHQHAAAAMQSLQQRHRGDGGRPIAHATATSGLSPRTRFIRLTYLHLLGAILAFAGLLYLLMTNATLYAKVSAPFINFALAKRWNWGIVLAAFMLVSWVADYWASHARSRAMQYAGLGLYVIAEAVIFVPLLAIVAVKTATIVARGGGDPNILRDSALVTLGIFTALTASVFLTKKDFSFLRSGLVMASGAALMLIVLSLTFGFNLGLVFSVAMVLLAAGYILYQTSQVLAHYDPNQYVAASLALFSSVALMFWYVIRIFMRARD